MKFNVFLHPEVHKKLNKLDKDISKRIREKLKKLEHDSKLGEPLKGFNFWKIRIGNYRAIYEIDKENKRIIVLFIGHRRNVYDNLQKFLFLSS